VKFEIGHVLFIDVVGYSKLLITEQSEQLQKLKEIVRGAEQVRLAEAEGKLLRLSTGDGGALCFVIALEAVKTLRRLLSIPAGLRFRLSSSRPIQCGIRFETIQASCNFSPAKRDQA
jgi:hypothetical protein